MADTVRNPRGITAVLRKAGIPTGYRYTQTGYQRHDGTRVTETGVMVTRQRRARYGGMEDVGAVEVYVVGPQGEQDKAVEEQAYAALVAAGLPARRRGSLIFVPDEEPDRSTDTEEHPMADSIAQQHRNNGLAYVRNAVAMYPRGFTPGTNTVNVEAIDGHTLVLDLSDGTTIRLTAERYPTDPRDLGRGPR